MTFKRFKRLLVLIAMITLAAMIPAPFRFNFRKDPIPPKTEWIQQKEDSEEEDEDTQHIA